MNTTLVSFVGLAIALAIPAVLIWYMCQDK